MKLHDMTWELFERPLVYKTSCGKLHNGYHVRACGNMIIVGSHSEWMAHWSTNRPRSSMIWREKATNFLNDPLYIRHHMENFTMVTTCGGTWSLLDPNLNGWRIDQQQIGHDKIMTRWRGEWNRRPAHSLTSVQRITPTIPLSSLMSAFASSYVCKPISLWEWLNREI